jgi:hypothetical protein
VNAVKGEVLFPPPACTVTIELSMAFTTLTYDIDEGAAVRVATTTIRVTITNALF